MPAATIVVQMRYTNWQKVKRALDGTNAHRKHFTATGHTLSRNVNDPAQVTAVVHFADLHGAREWVEAIMPPEKFATIFGGPGLSEIEIWLGEELEEIGYS